MRRRSRAGGELAKAQLRKPAARKSRVAPEAGRPRSNRRRNKGRAAHPRARRGTGATGGDIRVLRAISSTPADPQPVFEAMLAHAVSICDAVVGGICRWDGEAL